MKLVKLFLLVTFVGFGFSAFAQTSKTIDVYFYEQPLLFFKSDKSNDFSGVEADILKEFFKWCSEKKKINVTPKYYPYKTFNEFYTAMESAGPNSVGAGSVTITSARRSRFDFSAPYLKNVAVFVSHGSVPTFSTDAANISSATSRSLATSTIPFSSLGLVGLVEKGSVHSTYMNDFVTKYAPGMSLEGASGNLSEVFASDPKYVTYMDIITYRELLKKSDKYYKIHRELTMKGENFGYLFTKNSEWTPLFNEFMESGFGFTATRKYENILESYLGHELIQTVDMF